ncbi:DNA repair protein RecN [Aliibacillus thermotolerans]|uniref:DNA repair protein RecN n=1 Tax=Aliibacillus thermotolerans TaxID=1834418 RepID=A0ABW0U8Z6_9BACI|nr:DNA repair protein RecN [Aliibacillus thermotolerans]MDA3131146.1 DNA repair protein RecN [Aliibacillus thermotolerans]
MLEEITIKNFAIIEELTISFQTGLTVLTGETGAGKSIIIDAIGLLIGARGSVEFVRHGQDRAEIEGLFSIEKDHPIRSFLEKTGIDTSDDMVILRRDITNRGKSICRVNGKLVTLSILREVGQSLLDIHAQHEHQELMQPEKHLTILDRFAKEMIKETLFDYKNRYHTYQRLRSQWRKWQENDQEMANRLDFLQYQLREIEQASLSPNEDFSLEKERHVLSHSEKLYQQLGSTYNSLNGEGKALDWIGQAVAHIEEAAQIDSEMAVQLERIQEALFTLEESASDIRNRMEAISFDPNRLNEIEARLDEINRLKRKYGETVEEILEHAARIEEEIDSLSNKEEKLAALEKEMNASALDVKAEADTLTDLRKQAAAQLVQDIMKELADLYMEHARLHVEITNLTSGIPIHTEEREVYVNENGQDHVQFYIATNAGEPLKPLTKVASGGEISRIMLAMKTVLARFQHVTSLIFDEVDTGVSGRVAQSIAEKIYRVSTHSQVICISHLPQVAAMADHHLFIEKREKKDRVTTTVTSLNDEKRTEEIARMISGVEVTALAKENAKELLQMAEKIKTNS